MSIDNYTKNKILKEIQALQNKRLKLKAKITELNVKCSDLTFAIEEREKKLINYNKNL